MQIDSGRNWATNKRPPLAPPMHDPCFSRRSAQSTRFRDTANPNLGGRVKWLAALLSGLLRVAHAQSGACSYTCLPPQSKLQVAPGQLYLHPSLLLQHAELPHRNQACFAREFITPSTATGPQPSISSSRPSTTMDPTADAPSAPGDVANGTNAVDATAARTKQRTESMSQKSDNSQTAAEYASHHDRRMVCQ